MYIQTHFLGIGDHLLQFAFMEQNHLTIFFYLASSALAVFIFTRLKSRKTPPPNLPPGPWKLPLIGNLHNLIGALPHRALHRLSLKYGPLMYLKLGELSVFVVSSAQVAEQMLKTHDVNFASRPSTSTSDIIFYGNKDMASAPYGEHWRQVRKICVLHLWSHKRVRSFRFIREQVFVELMGWLVSHQGSPVDMTEKIKSSTYDIVSRSTLGDVRKEKELLLSVFTGILELLSGFNTEDLFPSVGLLQWVSKSRQRNQKYHDEVDAILEKIIQEHRGNNDEKERHEDFVDILLKNQQEGHLSTDSIKAVILDVYLAGIETSSTATIWALAEMMKNPEILDRTQQEVRQVFDPKGYVDESDMDQLVHLKSVIKETLRLHPPFPLLAPRQSMKKCVISGYEIPAESYVLVNGWAIARDPSYWNNPDCFQPERFLCSTVDYKGKDFEYIPFGAGRRICPGMDFGLANVQLPLAMLLYYFDWTLPVGMRPQEMDMSEAFGVTAPKKKALCIVPTLRRAITNVFNIHVR